MNRTTAEGAVIYAPLGRDADIAASLLADGDLESRIARDLAELVATIRGGVGYAILTEEAVRGADLRALTAVLAEQAEWSDLPFVMLTARGGGLERNPGAVRLLETLGNVTFLERPFHPTTLISLAKAARRARRRQYEARARLEEIAAGRERLSLALASGGLGAWIYEVKGAGLTTDAQCRAHYGLAADARFAFEDLLARIHDEDRQRMLATVLVAIEGATDYDIEYRVVWPDRSIHWLRINGRAERDAAGQVARMVGVSHDITDQRRIEARQRALIALGDGLRQADDATAMSRVAVRVLGETLGVSRAGYGTVDALRETVSIDCEWTAPGVAPLTGERSFRAYGSFVDDLKRGDWIAIADARTDPRTADRAEALEAIASRAVLNMPVVRAGTLVALLFVNQREPRAWMPDDVAFVHDVAGRTQAAIERRQAETALADLAGSLERQVEERTRERDRTWRNSQDLLAVIDGEGQFVAVNPAWTSVLGWQANEVVGRHHLDFNHPDDHLLSKAALAQAQEGQLPPSEKRMRHRDGSYRWVSWIASAGEGMVYASGRHVTAEKEAQLALEGTQDQLRQAQKMEAVGQLTGGIAHDFNNLLTAISGSLELIQLRVGQGRTGDVARYVDTATQAAKRAAALTHRLLAFSRRQTLDPRPSDLDALIANMRDLLERSVGPTIEIQVDAPEGALWTTLVDPNQFENALLNLCINARDAMRDGGRIAISTANIVLDRREAAARELAAGDYVMLAVSDSGAGMDAETIARAFDPFFTTKPLGEGTGLGLSMIYGFVRQSGGQVRIDSTVGVGTTMRLYFPRVADAEAVPETAAPAIEVKPVDADRVVLVVDDEAAVRMLVRDVVTDMGCAVIEAEDALAAMAVVESSARIDLMVTDVGLPGGTNGRELAKAARAIRADLTILFITGYAEAAVMGDGAPGAGMHLMTKPFSIDAIGARIRGLLA